MSSHRWLGHPIQSRLSEDKSEPSVQGVGPPEEVHTATPERVTSGHWAAEINPGLWFLSVHLLSGSTRKGRSEESNLADAGSVPGPPGAARRRSASSVYGSTPAARGRASGPG